MAFSKAKILRFNDIKTCAPPPGAYNPKFEKPAPVSSIYNNKETKEKGCEPLPSPSSSCSDVKSVRSCSTVPNNFRTPSSIPRKRKLGLFSSVGKKTVSSKLFSPKKNEKNEESEILREKIVECENKDETIKDMGAQIEELKQLLSNITKEKEDLSQQKDEAVDRVKYLQVEYETVSSRLSERSIQNREISQEIEKVQEELSELRLLEESLKEKLRIELDQKDNFIKQVTEKLKDKEEETVHLSQELIKRKEENLKLMFQYEESLHVQGDLQNRHSRELQATKKSYQTEVEDLEYEILKVVTESDKSLDKLERHLITSMEEMETKHKAEIEKLILEYEHKLCLLKEESEMQIRQSEENCLEKIKLVEIQTEETCKEIERNWELKMEEQEKKSADILKECQSIAEFNIIQCEVEKNGMKKKLIGAEETAIQLKEENDLLKTTNEDLQNSLSKLQTDLSKIIIELNDTREKLGTDIAERQNNLDEAIKEKHLYEFTLNKTYKTVNALKYRLLHSDSDVEQLKEELEHLEITKLETEAKYMQVTQDIHNLLAINEELKEENDLLKDIPEKLENLEIELVQKIDDLKTKADSEINKLNIIITEKQSNVEDLNSYIQLQQKTHSELQLILAEAKNEIERQETDFVDYKFQISRLEASLTSANRDLLQQEEFLVEKNDLIEELEKQIVEKEEEVVEITNTYRNYIDRNRNMEKQYDDLLMKCQKMEKIVDEQNSLIGPYRKQLISWKKSSTDKDIEKTKRMIENIQQELNAAMKKSQRRSKSLATPSDKENISSPVKQFNTSLLDSPGGASPLKERN